MAGELKLKLTARDALGGVLLPEQSAFFDLALMNEGKTDARVPALSGNRWTPVYRLVDGAGAPIREVTLSDLYRRLGAERGEPMEEEAQMATVRAGGALPGWIDLWSYIAPLPKGKYALVARHILDRATGSAIESSPVPFSIVDAKVRDVALGYQDAMRQASVMAWVAKPETGGAAQILVRLSAVDNHRSAQRSGMSMGETAEGTKIAVGGKPPEGTPNILGWVGALSPVAGQDSSLRMFSLNGAAAQWKSDPIAFPLREAVPVPGFPDRGHAVFMAVGKHGDGDHLVGVVVAPKGPVVRGWSVQLQTMPARTACVFGMEGSITLAMGTDDGESARLALIDVDEKGAVTVPERVVRTSPNALLALLPDRTPGNSGFLAIEEKRDHLNELVVVRIPLAGAAKEAFVPPIPLWPTVEGRLLPPLHFAMAVTESGQPLIAFLDQYGHYYAGAADGSALSVLTQSGKDPRIVLPQVAALMGRSTFAGFAENGALVIVGGR